MFYEFTGIATIFFKSNYGRFMFQLNEFFLNGGNTSVFGVFLYSEGRRYECAMLPGHLSLPGGLRQPPGQEDGGGRGPRALLPWATSIQILS